MTNKMFFQAVTDQSNALDLFLSLLNDIPYAVIGGVAVNAYCTEPVVTRDVDVCVRKDDLKPLLARAKKVGFAVTRHRATVDLTFPGSDLKIQLQRRPEYQDLATKGVKRSVMGYDLFVAPKEDVIAEKIKVSMKPSRPLSKRLKDQSDIARLEEEDAK